MALLRRGSLPLRAYFFVLALVFVVVAVAAILYVDRQADSRARAEASTDARFAAKTAATQLSNHLTLLKATVAQLAANPSIAQVFVNPAGCTLTYQGLGGPDRGHIDIVRADGTVMCSSRKVRGDARGAVYGRSAWLPRALAKTVFEAPVFDQATGAHVAVASAPIPGGKGVVAGFSDLTAVGPRLAELYGGGEAIEFLITSRDRRAVVARSIDPKRWIGAPLAGTAFATPATGAERRDLNGRLRLYEQYAVPGLGWHFFAGEDKAAAFATASQLRRSQIEIICAGLIAFFFAAWLVFRSVVAPIRRLSREVRSRTTGTLTTPVPVSGPLEVGALGDDVNALLGSVERELRQRERAEQLALEAEEQLRQAQRLEAVGQLAGGIAHDFNNLLTVISGYTESLLAKVDPRAEADLQQVAAAAERAALLTRQLLAFSRRQVLDPRVLNPNEAVSGIVPMLSRLIGDHIELVTIVDPNVPMVCADAGQLEQVLVNLAVNARDAMQDGGTLTIRTGIAELDEDYVARHVGASIGPHASISVTDTGTGMDAETLARMFEPFFTTKPVGKGTGLGLATVYGIIKQSGGDVWVYSEVGIGTTFKVYLPAVKGSPRVELGGERDAARSMRGSERILIAEDDESLRTLTTRMLEQRGYSVIAADSADHALALVEQQPDQIDLLLTDLVMPQMSGRTLAESVQERNPTTRVLFMSGYTDETLTASAAFLEKPFSGDELAQRVRQTLDA